MGAVVLRYDARPCLPGGSVATPEAESIGKRSALAVCRRRLAPCSIRHSLEYSKVICTSNTASVLACLIVLW